MSPLATLLRTIAYIAVALLLIFIACIPKKQLTKLGNAFKTSLQESIARRARYFGVVGGLCIAAFVIGRTAQIAGDFFDWPVVADFGGKAYFLSMVLFFVFGLVLVQAMQANELDRQRAGLWAFFRPRESMKIDIHGLSNSGTFAVSGTGSQINQSMQGNSITAINRDTLHSFTDDVEKEPGLHASARAEVVEELNTLTNQWGRPAARREQFKITKALERIPAILSAVGTLSESWQKLEPFIKAHFG